MTERRALVIGAHVWLDPAWSDRGGVAAVLRQIAGRLEAGGWRVRALLDDAPDDRHRPLLANVLDGLAWLAHDGPCLLVLSGAIQGDTFLVRDARANRLDRTGLPLAELRHELPATAAIIADVPLAPSAWGEARWALGQTPEAAPTAQGPGPFLSAVWRALAEAGPTSASVLAAAVAAHGGWARGDLSDGLLPALPAVAARACPSCQAPVPDVAAAFCPGCGGTLTASGTLDHGRYRLLRRLGAGGMGEVFLAEDARLKVRRAIKLLRLPPELPEEEAAGLRARMVQEARAAQALGETSHHVVRVFDVGHDPVRGEPFLVMELLDGETLADRLAQGPMARAEALRIGRTVARTLAQAHARQTVHRDLKPENIMLVTHGGRPDFVKLLDFGLVKLAQADVHTRSGHMMGTLQYMPPEQLKGEAVDARADVFALGAVLYECLSGVRALPGRSQQAIFAILLDRGVAPLAEVAPALPPALCALVDRCLQLDRAARPAHAGEVADALEAFESGALEATAAPSAPLGRAPAAEPIASSATPTPAAGAPAPRARAAWGLGAALLAGGAAWALWPAPPPAGSSPPAVIAQPADAARPADAGILDQALAARPDAAPRPAPSAAPAPQVAAPPAAWPADLGEVQTQSDGGGLAWTGGSPAQRYAAAIATLLLADPAGWGDLPPPLRPWLARLLAPQHLTASADRLTIGATARAAVEARRPAAWSLRGVGTLLAPPSGPPVFVAARCGDVQGRERLFTAQWSTPGYGDGRCEGARCLPALTRALKTARGVAESLRLTLGVGPLDGEADGGQVRHVRCRVRP